MRDDGDNVAVNVEVSLTMDMLDKEMKTAMLMSCSL